MGRGIVYPVDAMNIEPWSENLLDLLANHLVESGYDLKSFLRLIATSRICQSRADIREDGNSAYVFRGSVRKRMTAEQFLDTIRFVTGVWLKADGAAKLSTEKDPAKLARSVFLASLSRELTATEMNVAKVLLGNAPAAEQIGDFPWSVFMFTGFHYIN
jgi:hypothetical protein